MSNPSVITVTGASSYDVVIGHGVIGTHLGAATTGAVRCAVIVSESLPMLGKSVAEAIGVTGCEPHIVVVPDGERAKDIATLTRLWDDFGRINITRSDLVVAVGGGSVTDVGGYAAASWLRGVRWLAVPTSLLGMVDAAVGGKTAINTRAGKNLVGAFHPPSAVLCDLDALETLPIGEWVNGMAEVIKCGFIADERILDLAESLPSVTDALVNSPTTRELIERAVAVKAEVVSEDLRESGRREILNYGHTLGHALELRENYDLPHGHAVSMGMVFAATLSRASGRLAPDVAERHARLLQRAALPVNYAGSATWPEVLDAMGRDKKARGDHLRFIVLDAVGSPSVLEDPHTDALREAWHALTRHTATVDTP